MKCQPMMLNFIFDLFICLFVSRVSIRLMQEIVHIYSKLPSYAIFYGVIVYLCNAAWFFPPRDSGGCNNTKMQFMHCLLE